MRGLSRHGSNALESFRPAPPSCFKKQGKTQKPLPPVNTFEGFDTYGIKWGWSQWVSRISKDWVWINHTLCNDANVSFSMSDSSGLWREIACPVTMTNSNIYDFLYVLLILSSLTVHVVHVQVTSRLYAIQIQWKSELCCEAVSVDVTWCSFAIQIHWRLRIAPWSPGFACNWQVACWQLLRASWERGCTTPPLHFSEIEGMGEWMNAQLLQQPWL